MLYRDLQGVRFVNPNAAYLRSRWGSSMATEASALGLFEDKFGKLKLSTMKTLFLCRHATSIANAGEYWADGPTTIPLSEFGLRQADEFAENWDLQPDLIVVSSYARSIQTATPLARKFGLPLITLDVREFTFWDFRFSQREYEVDRKLDAAASGSPQF